jgi:hypothetical protein
MLSSFVVALLHVASAKPSAAVAPRSNPFGIGAYYPPGAGQIPTAAELVGAGGWVLILVPCGNVTSETQVCVCVSVCVCVCVCV